MGKSNRTGITEKQLSNLIPFKKGDDPRRNLNGRPEGSVSIVEGIKRKLLEIEPTNKKTYLELFLSKLFLKAIKEGNEQLMRDMIDRVDGKALQKIESKVTNIENELDKLETDYDQFASEVAKQSVADEPPVQDQG